MLDYWYFNPNRLENDRGGLLWILICYGVW
jgi:hypothetical protein